MVTKKQLEKEGYKFLKIGKVEYLDLSSPRGLPSSIAFDIEIQTHLKEMYNEEAIKKGKTLSVILPLISNSNLTELFAELYNLREIVKFIKEEKEKCRPKKPKNQKKKQKK